MSNARITPPNSPVISRNDATTSEVKVPINSHFNNAIDYINTNNLDIIKFLVPNIKKLESCLIRDAQQGYLTTDLVTNIGEDLLQLIQLLPALPTTTSNDEKASDFFEILERNNKKSQKLFKQLKHSCLYVNAHKWRSAGIGAVIGASIYIVFVAAITLIISAADNIPVGPEFKMMNLLLCTYGILLTLLGGFIGYNKVYETKQYSAQKKLYTIADSIHAFFPNYTTKEFFNNQELKPTTVTQIATKLVSIHYLNLEITVEDIKKTLSEFLTTGNYTKNILNKAFIDKLINFRFNPKRNLILATLLPGENKQESVQQAINALPEQSLPQLTLT